MFHAGISTVKSDYDGFRTAITEADTSRNQSQQNVCGLYKAVKLSPRTDCFSGMERQISERVKQGKWEIAADEIKENMKKSGKEEYITFADQYFAQKMIVQTAKILNMSARRTGMKWTMQGRMKDLLTGSGAINLQEDVAHDVTERMAVTDDWLDYFERELRDLSSDMDRPVRESNEYVEMAVRWMQSNYMQDLSLEIVADRIGITQFYLSRLLKQERNQTFLEILTDIRLTRALELMRDPTRTLQGISNETGYTPKYFYQVFHTSFGISAKNFRDALLQKEI